MLVDFCYLHHVTNTLTTSYAPHFSNDGHGILTTSFRYNLPKSMENKLSTTIVRPAFLRLPPEIRLKIYRLLLLSDITVRMQWLHEEDYTRPPNDLFPAILSTCHFIYDEAMDVLYRENLFRAHRVNEGNNNAALITRAKFTIGTNGMEDGEMDASGLATFLEFHPNLKVLKLEFKGDLLEDSNVRNTLSNALLTSGYSSDFSVLSDFKSTRSAFNEARLVQSVGAEVRLQKMLETIRRKG